MKCAKCLTPTKFQSTLPMRGATNNGDFTYQWASNFNPRSPCGERLCPTHSGIIFVDFNPRSPCGERHLAPKVKITVAIFQSTLPMRGATEVTTDNAQYLVFQSTLPMRGATMFKKYAKPLTDISIHAPHAGSDLFVCILLSPPRHFNPRSPCGERLFGTFPKVPDFIFQSTLPMRGATARTLQSLSRCLISIHAPHAGSDSLPMAAYSKGLHFNPRSPCGERHCTYISLRQPRNFNPRSPCGERRPASSTLATALDFNPRSPCGERRSWSVLYHT